MRVVVVLAVFLKVPEPRYFVIAEYSARCIAALSTIFVVLVFVLLVFIFFIF